MITLEFYPSEGARSETVEWALNATAATIQNMRVNHRCPDVLVAEQFLYGPDVVSRGQQVSRERMAKCVRTDLLGDS